MGYTIKDFSEDDDFKFTYRVFISDKDDNNVVMLSTKASIYKDINSINIKTAFRKGVNYKNKYELLKLVIEFCESYEKEIDEDFKESIEDYESFKASGKLSIDPDFDI